MPQIRVKSGRLKGKIIPVAAQPITIGRDPECTLQITERGISREHAKIYRVGEMIFIRDLDSRNGSFVNGEKVKEELLREGDCVRLGVTQLIFENRHVTQRNHPDIEYQDTPFISSLELRADDLKVLETSVSLHVSEHFKALCQVAAVIQSERELKRIFERVLDVIQEYVPASHIYLFARDENTGAVTPQVIRRRADAGNAPVSRSILQKVISESKAILTADAMNDERFKMGDSIIIEKIKAVLCAPILGGAEALGAIYAVNTDRPESFDQDDLQLISAIGAQLATVLENRKIFNARRKLYVQLIGRLLAAASPTTDSQRCHAERVGEFCRAIAGEMHLSEQEILNAELAGLLHEIATAPPGPVHLENVDGLQKVLAAARACHEHFDGSGLPNQLKGDVIPLAARIVAVASAFDELLYPGSPESASPPTEEPSPRTVFIKLDEQSGKRFDPQVVQTLMVAYRHGSLPVPSVEAK